MAIEYYSFNGRLNRAKFAALMGFSALLTVPIGVYFYFLVRRFAGDEASPAIFIAAFSVVLIPDGIFRALQIVKRFHDLGMPGRLYWLLWIPIVNFYYLYILFAQPGTRGANTYGPDPRQELFFTDAEIGNALTVLAALVFLLVLIILPIVGPAPMRGSGSPGAGPAPWAYKNIMAFTGVLLFSILLAALSFLSKQGRRKREPGRFPWVSFTLLGIQLLLLIVFALGGLQI